MLGTDPTALAPAAKKDFGVWRPRLARLMQSPLTDSNRRAPPYRGGVAAGTAGRLLLIGYACGWPLQYLQLLTCC